MGPQRVKTWPSTHTWLMYISCFMSFASDLLSEQAKFLQSCPTLCDPLDCSPSASSVHRIIQERILEWVAMPSSRGSSRSGTEPSSSLAPALQADFLQLRHLGSSNDLLLTVYFLFILDYGNDIRQKAYLRNFRIPVQNGSWISRGNINNTFGPGIANECTMKW